MDNCVNINLDEFKNLANQTDTNKIILAAKVGVWLDHNETYPTLEQLGIVEKVEPENIQEQFKASIPQNLVSGFSAFGTLQEATSAVKKVLGENPHSIDMIESGFRTRTTRSASEMQKYNIKVGDTIKHFGKSADGTTKTVFAKVTAIYLKGTSAYLDTWNKEGWTEEGIKNIERFKDGAAAIEFEVIDVDKLGFIQDASEVKPILITKVEYTGVGKTSPQTYTVVDNKILNSKNKEVFKTDTKDRRKILAKLAVANNEAEIVKYKDTAYIVYIDGKILSTISGDFMKWDSNNGNRKAILADTKLLDSKLVSDNTSILETLAVSQKIKFKTFEQLKKEGVFQGTQIEFVDTIPTTRDKPVYFRDINKGEKIQIVEKGFKQLFKNKAWRISATQKDGSKSIPLEDFQNINEFLTFILLHEKSHEYIFKLDTETIGQYEDRINTETYLKLSTYNASEYTKLDNLQKKLYSSIKLKNSHLENLPEDIPSLLQVNTQLSKVKAREAINKGIKGASLKGQQFFWWENGEKKDLFQTELYTNETEVVENKGLKQLHQYLKVLKDGETSFEGVSLQAEILKTKGLINFKYSAMVDLVSSKKDDPNIETEERAADVLLPQIYATEFSIREGTILEDVDVEYFIVNMIEDSDTSLLSGDYIAVNSDGNHKIILLKNSNEHTRIENSLIEAQEAIRNGVRTLVTKDEFDYTIEDGVKVYYHPTQTDSYGNRLEVWIVDSTEAMNNQYKNMRGFISLEAKPNKDNISYIINNSITYFQSVIDNINSLENPSSTDLDLQVRAENKVEQLSALSGDDIDVYIKITSQAIESRKIKSIKKLAAKKMASWNKSLNFIVGRIPGQGLQSFMSMRVAGFIETEQNTVVVPPEQLWFQGADMDIDKANLIGYSFNKGQFVGWNKDFDITKKESFSLPLDMAGIPEYLHRSAMKNFIVSEMWNIIQSPKNIIGRARPMEMGDLQELKNMIENSIENIFSPNQPISVQYQTNANNVGAEVIGIAAVTLKVFSAISTMYAKNIESFPNGGFEFKGKLYHTIASQNFKGLSIEVVEAFSKKLLNSEIAAEVIDKYGVVDEKALSLKLISEMNVSHDVALKLSALLSAATDNAKELILSKINAIPGFVDIYAVAYVVGIPTEDIASLMMSEDVNDIIKATQTSIFSENTEFKTAIDIALEMTPTQDVRDFIMFRSFADEYAVMGSMFSVNQGLKIEPYTLYKYQDRIEKFINNRMSFPKERMVKGKLVAIPFDVMYKTKRDWIKKEGFDFNKFVNDDSYAQEWIEKYENGYSEDKNRFKGKDLFNILKVFKSNPHYMAYFKMFTTEMEMLGRLSYKMRDYKKVIDEVKDKQMAFSIDENTFKGIHNMLDNSVIVDFLKDKSFKVKAGSKIEMRSGNKFEEEVVTEDTEISLSSQLGRHQFIKWFNQFANELRSNKDTEYTDFTNRLVKNDRRIRLTANKADIWKMSFTANKATNADNSILIDASKIALKKMLNNNLLDSANNNIIDILFLYNLIVNKNGNTPDSFTSIIPYELDGNNLLSEFTTFQSNAINSKVDYVVDNLVFEGVIQEYAQNYVVDDTNEYGGYNVPRKKQPIYNRQFSNKVIIRNKHKVLNLVYSPLSIYDNDVISLFNGKVKKSIDAKYKTKRSSMAVLMQMTNKLKQLGAKVELLDSKDIKDQFDSTFLNARAFVFEGIIYVNTDLASANDLIHELGHLYMPYIKSDKVMWEELKVLLREHPLLSSITKDYKGTEDDVLEELFVTLVGENKVISEVEQDWWNRFKTYMKNVNTLITLAYRDFFNLNADFVLDTTLPLANIIDKFSDDIMKNKLVPEYNINSTLIKKHKITKNCE